MPNRTLDAVAGVVAAAGRSRRMGRFKPLLPWGQRTIIATVIHNLAQAGVDLILCVVGHRAQEIQAALAGSPAVPVLNPAHATGEVLSSYQAGVRALLADGRPLLGALLALGDQPHIPWPVIQALLIQARSTPDRIVVPSHNRRRGHPIFLPRSLWDELLALGPDATLRDLLHRHTAQIHYVTVATDAVLRDLDTFEEYRALCPPSTTA